MAPPACAAALLLATALATACGGASLQLTPDHTRDAVELARLRAEVALDHAENRQRTEEDGARVRAIDALDQVRIELHDAVVCVRAAAPTPRRADRVALERCRGQLDRVDPAIDRADAHPAVPGVSRDEFLDAARVAAGTLGVLCDLLADGDGDDLDDLYLRAIEDWNGAAGAWNALREQLQRQLDRPDSDRGPDEPTGRGQPGARDHGRSKSSTI